MAPPKRTDKVNKNNFSQKLLRSTRSEKNPDLKEHLLRLKIDWIYNKLGNASLVLRPNKSHQNANLRSNKSFNESDSYLKYLVNSQRTSISRSSLEAGSLQKKSQSASKKMVLSSMSGNKLKSAGRRRKRLGGPDSKTVDMCWKIFKKVKREKEKKSKRNVPREFQRANCFSDFVIENNIFTIVDEIFLNFVLNNFENQKNQILDAIGERDQTRAK